MLKKIVKIENFGIFDNYKNEASLKEFKEFNVFYGWNGSGKTTLSRLFRCLENKGNHNEFPDAKYIIETTDGNKIDSSTLSHLLDLRVFNSDFISENLNLFDAQTKPIIFISKEKVEEKKEYDLKKLEIKKKNEDLKKLIDGKQSALDFVDNCHKDGGKAIKDFLLGTVYANVTYNKATSRKIWDAIKGKSISLKESVLTNDELTREKNYTLVNSRLNSIEEVTFPAAIDLEKIRQIAFGIKATVETKVTSKVIERLRDNPEISDWVETGFNLHRAAQNKTCEFCGETIKNSRMESLEAYYNDEYATIIRDIETSREKLIKGKRDAFSDINHMLYTELRNDYSSILNELNAAVICVNGKIDEWINMLDKKQQNPFSIITMNHIDESIFEQYNDKISGAHILFKKHNEINSSYQKLAENAKSKIEFHFVCQFALKSKLKEKEDGLALRDEEIKTFEKEIITIKDRIKYLEGELRSDTIAIAEINTSLHKFLGRNDIVLDRIEQGGYQLKRNGIVARNLSEGEKTAISLIYFFSKIKENAADIRNLIIVLDDPISSFDSNHLFNASSYIRHSTIGCKQLFILSHNFWFFKQIRDWMLKKNKKDEEVTSVYSIERGNLKAANNPLVKFNSEYQHVFHTVLNYQTLSSFDESACFTIANSIRRLLEGFTSFKTPDNGNFNGALQLAEKRGLAPELRERIFYFLNKYSHLDRIESFDNTVETLVEEGYNVVQDVLFLIRSIDKEHYESMLKVCEFKEPVVKS